MWNSKRDPFCDHIMRDKDVHASYSLASIETGGCAVVLSKPAYKQNITVLNITVCETALPVCL